MKIELGIVPFKRYERDIWTEYQETPICLLTLNLNHKTVDKRLLHLGPILFSFVREKHMEGAKSTHSKSLSSQCTLFFPVVKMKASTA